jgi:phosphopantetheinyl transferase
MALVPATELGVSASAEGKPLLPDLPQAHVSVTHSESVVAVAVSADTPIGADVELARAERVAELRRIAQRWFAASEAAWLTLLDDAQLPEWFTRVWTAKEAIGKAIGVGFAPALAGAVLERRGAVLALKELRLASPVASFALHELTLPDGGERLCLAAPSPVVRSAPPTQLTLGDFADAVLRATRNGALPPLSALR